MKILKLDFNRELQTKPVSSNNIQEILVIMTGSKPMTWHIWYGKATTTLGVFSEPSEKHRIKHSRWTLNIKPVFPLQLHKSMATGRHWLCFYSSNELVATEQENSLHRSVSSTPKFGGKKNCLLPKLSFNIGSFCSSSSSSSESGEKANLQEGKNESHLRILLATQEIYYPNIHMTWLFYVVHCF